MTEPTPNDLGFYLFPDEPSCNKWIDEARVEGAEDPMMVAIFPPDNMIPAPRSWSAINKSQALELRRIVDDSLAKSRGKHGPEFAGSRYFGFMADGKPVAGGLLWKKGAMTWPVAAGPTPAQLAKWSARDGLPNGAANGGGTHTETVPAPPAAPASSAYVTHDLMHHTPSPAVPPPGFPMNAFNMTLDKAIVVHPDAAPVMLIVKDGKIALKKLA